MVPREVEEGGGSPQQSSLEVQPNHFDVSKPDPKCASILNLK